MRLNGREMNGEKAFALGIDCAIYGPNKINCHFSIFSEKEFTREWEAGKKFAMDSMEITGCKPFSKEEEDMTILCQRITVKNVLDDDIVLNCEICKFGIWVRPYDFIKKARKLCNICGAKEIVRLKSQGKL